MKTRVTLMFVLLVFSLGAAAQEIFGTITDTKKEPLVNASVVVKQKGIKVGGSITDFDGRYSIKPLDTGYYDVEVSYVGYSTKLITKVTVTPGNRTILNVAMTADGKTSLKCAVITEYKNPPINKYRHSNIVPMPGSHTSTMDMSVTSSGYYQSQRGAAMQYQSAQAAPVYLNPSTESYKKMPANEFMTVKSTPMSTMSVDVDRASYTNIRRFINAQQRPPADAVRIEEMVNYFEYDYAQPKGKDPVAFETQVTTCPWQKEHLLLRIGLQAKTIKTDDLPPSNLVFLIDVSGSMMEPAKLPLLQQGMALLVDQLREQDMVSMVVYAGNAGLVLPPTSGSKKEDIKRAINSLTAGGSTAGGAGIQLAYKVAEEQFMKGGNNRVILCTDGDFNIGVSNNNELEDLITKKRSSGVFLTCLGFGTGNYKDDRMEMLADKGNGNYNYIDNIDEARKTLVSEFGGTIFTVAKDVKCQIEFNPSLVQSYKLVGYENRLLNTEDFKDDKKDAGDMGSGHTVTILYEIIPVGSNTTDVRPTNDLKYQNAQFTAATYTNEMATIKLRYKQPADSISTEMTHVVTGNIISFDKADENTSFSAAVAMFGMLLRNDKGVTTMTYNNILDIAKNNTGKDKKQYRAEFISLVKAQATYDDRTSVK